MLICFQNTARCVSLAAMTNAQLSAAFVTAMKPFVKNPVVVTNIYINNWQNDPFALGAWTHAPVNVGN